MSAPKLKPTHYILEFIVVVLGISIAFMLDRWRDSNQKNELRITYTKQLIKDIEFNKSVIDSMLVINERSLLQVKETAKLLREKKEAEINIQYTIYALLSLQNVTIQTSSYESIKSSGNLELFSHAETQYALTNMFSIYAVVLDVNEIYNTYNHNYIMPFLHGNFDFLERMKPVSKFNPNSVEFKNIISGYTALMSQSMAFMKQSSSFSDDALKILRSSIDLE